MNVRSIGSPLTLTWYVARFTVSAPIWMKSASLVISPGHKRRRQRSLISSSLAPLHAKSLVTRTGRRTDFMRDSSSIKNSVESPPLASSASMAEMSHPPSVSSITSKSTPRPWPEESACAGGTFSARTSASMEENNADARSSVMVRPHETRIVLECIARLLTALPDNGRFPTSSRAHDILPIRHAWPK